jgi:hypothetical protein
MIPKEMLFYHNDGRFSSLKLVIFGTGLIYIVTWLTGLIGAFFGMVLDPNFYIFTAVPFTGGTVMRAWQMVAEAKSKATKHIEHKPTEQPKAPAKKLEPQKPVIPFPLTVHDMAASDGTPVPEKYMQNALDTIRNVEIIWREAGCPKMKKESGYRTPKINKATPNAANNSWHLRAGAMDFKFEGWTAPRLRNLIEKLIDEGKIRAGGFYAMRTSVHYDIRGETVKINR